MLPGDGVGKEIAVEAVKVLEVLSKSFEMEFTSVGSAGYEAKGHLLSEDTLKLAKEIDAILFGAVGDWKYDTLARELRPERAIPDLCKRPQLFTNFRPAIYYPELAGASDLKLEIVTGLDILIVRGLDDDIYSGQPRGVRTAPDELSTGVHEGFDTMRYAEPEIRRIMHVVFRAAVKRDRKLYSVDRANALETFQFWKDIVTDIHKEHPEVELSHMYVDNMAIQFVKAPKDFDIVVTGNIFGDILSDEAAMLTDSIGMLPSVSLGVNNEGLYEPSYGSTPDIAGRRIANPLATILSATMMLRYPLSKVGQANRIESAVKKVLAQGYRTGDILIPDCKQAGTVEMGDVVVAAS